MRAAPPELVLASGSPRRTELLSRWGLAHVVDPAEVDESALPGEAPVPHVLRLAREKALQVAARHPGALVLAGDTVVIRDDTILGKPSDADEARRMLRALSGRTHRVVSGLALVLPQPGPDQALEVRTRASEALVTFRPLDPATVEAYVATGEPMDKAGAYGIQGLGSALVARMEGDYYTVVGLPVSALIDLLADAGWRYAFGSLEPL